jgi:glycosyltransferase involved in cell wall biosynthesis
MMRIGYLTYGLDRNPTGIGRYAVALLEALAELPAAPEIVLLTTESDDPHGLWQRFERHALPGCRLLPALLTVGDIALATAARRYRLDVVHDPNGIAPFLSPRGQTRRVVTVHDAFAYVHPETHNTLDNWRYRWHLPHAARRADAVLTVSQASRADLGHFLGLSADRIYVIAEAADPRFRPRPDGQHRRQILARYGIDQPYLLYVGGLNARKNIARLLEAFAQLRPRYPNLRLVIAGKRQWKSAEIDAAFARLALGNSVYFTGYVDDADLPDLYSAAELFVFPSLYEGFGLPPLEAMACGTPVVTSNCSSLPEVVGDAAVTVPPHDAEAITRGINDVLSSKARQADLRRRGLERAASFSWAAAAQTTLALYTALVGRALAGAPASGR